MRSFIQWLIMIISYGIIAPAAIAISDTHYLLLDNKTDFNYEASFLNTDEWFCYAKPPYPVTTVQAHNKTNPIPFAPGIHGGDCWRAYRIDKEPVPMRVNVKVGEDILSFIFTVWFNGKQQIDIDIKSEEGIVKGNQVLCLEKTEGHTVALVSHAGNKCNKS